MSSRLEGYASGLLVADPGRRTLRVALLCCVGRRPRAPWRLSPGRILTGRFSSPQAARLGGEYSHHLGTTYRVQPAHGRVSRQMGRTLVFVAGDVEGSTTALAASFGFRPTARHDSREPTARYRPFWAPDGAKSWFFADRPGCDALISTPARAGTLADRRIPAA